MSIRRESNTITLASFWENQQLNKYNYDPGYQRNSVWSEEKQSFLIDSILKNIPIPPIFLHQLIDSNTGKTTYDVIDGKQRLISISNFIDGVISSASEDDASPLFDDKISGLSFNDLKRQENEDIRKQFWRYSIPIEYVDTSDKKIIDAIFDRLNRNGEPLKGQELRRSTYYGTPLLNTIESFSRDSFWRSKLLNLDVQRMEDIEFISEILFYQLEGNKYFASNQKVLDQLYKKYNNKQIDFEKIKNDFSKTTKYMKSLELNYDEFKISGVSHLYAIWCVSMYLSSKNKDISIVKPKINLFFKQLRGMYEKNEYTKAYKKSMSSGTKGLSQRTSRVQSLIKFIEAD